MERKTLNTMPVTGNMVGGDDTVSNLVTLLGGTEPVSDNTWEIRNFEPRSGLVIGPDSKVYSLPDMIGSLREKAESEYFIPYDMDGHTSTKAEFFDAFYDAWNKKTIPIIYTWDRNGLSLYKPVLVAFSQEEGMPREFRILISNVNMDIVFVATENDPDPVGTVVHLLVNADTIAAGDTPLATSFAPVYSATASYAVGDLVWKNGLYKCKTAITGGEAWTKAHWTLTSAAAEFARA